jgi:hypothetical protein
MSFNLEYNHLITWCEIVFYEIANLVCGHFSLFMNLFQNNSRGSDPTKVNLVLNKTKIALLIDDTLLHKEKHIKLLWSQLIKEIKVRW